MIVSSLRRLNVFKTVVDLEGVNAAANRLGIAQPSVTAHIKALENQIGTSLFVRRRGRRLRPTRAGEALYTYACDAVTKAEEAHQALRKASGTSEQEFSVVAPRALGVTMLPPILASFLQRFPHARISMHTESLEMAVELGRSGKRDVAIVIDGDENESGDAEVLGREPIVFIAAPNHPLAGRRAIEPRELQTYSFVAPLREAMLYRLLKAGLMKFGMTEYPVILHTQEPVSLMRAVAYNVGIACALRTVVRDEVARGNLVMLDVARETPCLTVRCIRRPGAQLPAIAVEFIKHLKEEIPKQ
jgi:DNA-binding transcriptional LysR family regulator